MKVTTKPQMYHVPAFMVAGHTVKEAMKCSPQAMLEPRLVGGLYVVVVLFVVCVIWFITFDMDFTMLTHLHVCLCQARQLVMPFDITVLKPLPSFHALDIFRAAEQRQAHIGQRIRAVVIKRSGRSDQYCWDRPFL